MLGMLLAAIEATAVGTAMPTAVAELGGVARYSWVFSAYLLTSTTTVPLYGKLADLYGRRRMYSIAVALFLVGSALSGAATTIEQLIAFRAIQGLGAGGVAPVAITVIGDIYPLKERGKIQGLFSGVWGVSSLLGPAVGGLVTDALSWRWIFYLNIPFGIASAVMLWAYLKEAAVRREHRLDVLGTVSLTLSVTLLLVALLEGSDAWGWSSPLTLGLLAGSAALLVLFLWQEQRAPEPMLPLGLFRNRVIAVSSVGSVVIGTLLFSASAYVPMYAQGVLGGSAVDAGMVLAPMSIGWPITSTLAGWLVLRTGYRPLVLMGGAIALGGSIQLASVDAGTDRLELMLAMLVVGMGLGLLSTPYLLAVQNAVPWKLRGVATSSAQFFRTIGGAIAIAALGAVLNARLESVLGQGVSPNTALDAELRRQVSPETLSLLVTTLREGLGAVYATLAAVAAVGLISAFFFPRGSAAEHAHVESGSRPA